MTRLSFLNHACLEEEPLNTSWVTITIILLAKLDPQCQGGGVVVCMVNPIRLLGQAALTQSTGSTWVVHLCVCVFVCGEGPQVVLCSFRWGVAGAVW